MKRRVNLIDVLLALGVIVVPAAITFLFIYGYKRASLTDFIPHYYPLDDLYYWRQIYTFSAVGFNGGYIVPDELAAPASFTHYGAHGPLFPMIYGIVGRVVGWEPYSPVLFNLAVLMIALAIVIAFLRFDRKQLIFTGIFIATSWPLLFYILSGLQESLHQAFAILLAAGFGVMIKRRGESPRWFGGMLLGFVFFISLLRLTWIFLAFPLLLLWWERFTLRRVILAGVLTILLLVIVLGLTSGYLYAPYPANFISELQREVGDSWRDNGLLAALETGLDLLGRNIGENVEFFNEGTRLEIGSRYQFVFLLGVLGGWWILAKRRASNILPDVSFNLYNLGFIFLVNLVLYLMAGWRDYRVFAPHLLLTGLLLIVLRRYRLAALIIATNLILFLPFKDYYLAYGSVYLSHDQSSITRFEETTDDLFVYEPDADNAWCNTLLINYDKSYAPPLVAVPPGIGMSYFVVPQKLDLPIKSRYLLLDQEDYEYLREYVDLRELVGTEIGTLYLNARCGGE